jgi:ribonuclease HI
MAELWINKWNLQCEKLFEFKRKNGHCLVPSTYQQEKSPIGQWAPRAQRTTHHTNTKLQEDPKILLNELEFVGKVEAGAMCNNKSWHQNYKKLSEFKRKNGHCLVPSRYEQDKSLGLWVRAQRKTRNNKKLHEDRKELLDELGFVWNVEQEHEGKRCKKLVAFKPRHKNWHQNYKKLFEFKRKSGHCLVPSRYQEDKPLGQWVRAQRKSYTNNKLQEDRKELLDELGFVWNVEEHEGRRCKKLLAFKQQHEHCIQPSNYKEDVSLGTSVATQQNFHIDNTIRQDQKALLDSEASTSSVGLPKDAIEETEPSAQAGPVRNRFEGPSLANRKRLRICLAESGEMVDDIRNPSANDFVPACQVDTSHLFGLNDASRRTRHAIRFLQCGRPHFS